MTLHALEDTRYAWLEGQPGSLLLRSEAGDTLVPNHDGRWTFLEEASTLADAQAAARDWAEMASRGPQYGFSNDHLDALVRVVELCRQVETAMKEARKLLEGIPTTGRAISRPWSATLPCSPFEAKNAAGLFEEIHNEEIITRAVWAATRHLVD